MRGKEERQMRKASRTSGQEESVFRLLVPSRDTVSSETVSIDVAGQRWQVVDHGTVPFPAHAPEYICVSFSWGDPEKREWNPFDPQRPLPSRARPVLETAIVSLRPAAIWLDVACVPSQEPARSLCLRNMGAIYAAARSV